MAQISLEWQHNPSWPWTSSHPPASAPYELRIIQVVSHSALTVLFYKLYSLGYLMLSNSCNGDLGAGESHLLKVTQLGQNSTDPNCIQPYLIPWLCWSLPVSVLVTSNLYFCATGKKIFTCKYSWYLLLQSWFEAYCEDCRGRGQTK